MLANKNTAENTNFHFSMVQSNENSHCEKNNSKKGEEEIIRILYDHTPRILVQKWYR